MQTIKARISKRTVDALECPATGEARLWDTELRGFLVRARAGGRKVYAVKLRVDGRQKLHTIGAHGSPWTPDDARKRAVEVLRAGAAGEDANAAKAARKADISVSDLIVRYLEEGPLRKPEKRASSWNADRGCLNNHVKPLIGSKMLRQVEPLDIGRMIKAIEAGDTAKVTRTKPRGVAKVTGGEGIANRTLAVTKAAFEFAKAVGLIKVNPCDDYRVKPSNIIERYLTAEEAARVEKVMAALEASGELSPAHACILRLLFLTGARKTEIVALRWSEIDLARGVLTLPPKRTKAGGQNRERRITLSAAAIEIIQAIEPTKSPFLFPAARGKGATTNVQDAWEIIRVRAELPTYAVDDDPLAKSEHVRMHDLRHSYASFVVNNGGSLYAVSKALGHASMQTTTRYAHLEQAAVKAAAELVATALGKPQPEPAQ